MAQIDVFFFHCSGDKPMKGIENASSTSTFTELMGSTLLMRRVATIQMHWTPFENASPAVLFLEYLRASCKIN